MQLVFATSGRASLIPASFREELQRYTTEVVQNDGHRVLAIYCMPDHMHLLVGLNPDISVSSLVLDTKRATTNFIKQKNVTSLPFHWQKGYGAFSYSKSQVPNVIKYILNQDEHHKKHSFREEYLQFLKIFEVEYKDENLFEFYD